MAILDLLGRRWTLRVLWELRGDPVPTFRALQQHCDGVSSSVLAERLAELRDAAIVERTEAGYQLTGQGLALLNTLAPLEKWAKTWRPAPAPAVTEVSNTWTRTPKRKPRAT